MKKNNHELFWGFVTICVLGCLLWLAETYLDRYKVRIINLIAINAILALSLNLIYGMTGMFSLGHAGFMAIGAYISAILVLSPEQKVRLWILKPIYEPFINMQMPFLGTLVIAGLGAALLGLIIGLAVLKLGGDYLGIVTLGFAEIIRILITNWHPLTNGSLGIKGIPFYANIWVSYVCLVLTVFFMVRLMRSSTGNILRAIRDDEIAARTMGVNTFKYRVLSFTIGCFFAGLGGALLGNLIGTIDPGLFKVTLTFQVLMIVVVGGLGSISGSLIGSAIITYALEWLRIVENQFDFGFIASRGIPGLRMVIFSALLIIIIIVRREGIMGTKEFPLFSKDREVA
ncbi:MAG: branched-chain amino acid ABC transporter permease [Synergistaceae bacterium]|nr:branched-chain amino acid ABC transporter permease [Synergistaceae bacterium]